MDGEQTTRIARFRRAIDRIGAVVAPKDRARAAALRRAVAAEVRAALEALTDEDWAEIGRGALGRQAEEGTER